MTKSNMYEAVINYAIDICLAAIKVVGINAVLADNDIVEISKLISEVKQHNYNMMNEILDDFEYSQDQRYIVFDLLEAESKISVMLVKKYFDNYRGVEV